MLKNTIKYIFLIIFLWIPWIIQAQTWKIGDLIVNDDGSKGIVFWINPEGTGGWMVALTDASNGICWSTTNTTVPCLDDKIQSLAALTDMGGYENTKCILRTLDEDAKAAFSINFRSGWYLPSAGQLKRLFSAHAFISSALRAENGDALQEKEYWTSTQWGLQNAYAVSFSTGSLRAVGKNASFQVRAIRSFEYKAIAYDTTLNYQWTTGEITPGINVTPSTTTYYTVTASSKAGCSSKVSKRIFVSSDDNSTVYDTIRRGETYTKYGFNQSEPGTYSGTFSSPKGCNIKITLHLTVIEPIPPTIFTETICLGTVYNKHNFSERQAGTYTQNWKARNGADSIVTLHLSVNPTYEKTIRASICRGETYTGNGFNESVTGIYRKTLATASGCDSIIILHLSSHPAYEHHLTASVCEGDTYTANGFKESVPGIYSHHFTSKSGCDSIVTLALTANPSHRDTINAVIAEGSIYNQNGFNESSTGIYTQTHTSRFGCDSLVTLQLTVSTQLDTIRASICEGEVYSKNGFREFKTGIYTRHLTDSHGQDSTITLCLQVNPIYNIIFKAAICQGETYAKNGFLESVAGIYKRTQTTISGCDSIAILDLVVHPSFSNSIYDTICKGDIYTNNGFNVSEPGIHTKRLKTHSGCDSIVTLYLSVNNVQRTNLSATICEGERYSNNGFDVTTPGIHSHNRTSSSGCDSIVTLVLNVHPVYNKTIQATICEGETYIENGFSENTQGVYTQNLTSSSGCDSVIVLALSVHPAYLFKETVKICQGESYTFRGQQYQEPGTYEDNLISKHGCDSTFRLMLSVDLSYNRVIEASVCEGITYQENGFSENTTGEYVHRLQTTQGCDSITTLRLKVLNRFQGNIVVSLEDCHLHTYRFSLLNELEGDTTNYSYFWTFGDHSSSSEYEVSHRYSNSGNYQVAVAVKNKNICETIMGKTLIVPFYTEDFEIFADRTTVNNKYPKVKLWATPYPDIDYKWNLGDGTSLSGNRVEHVYDLDKQSFYDTELTLVNSEDCIAVKTLRINTEKDLVIPNTFSPNNDGYNDVFMAGYNVQIIDRNGILVFEGNNGWDGSGKGGQVPEDTYFYIIHYTTSLGKQEITGYINLLR